MYAMASTAFVSSYIFFMRSRRIFFNPMYEITFHFALAFPIEFSFEYGFPVPGLATRVAICAISGAFLKYLVFVLHALNAAFGMSMNIKLSALK